MRLQIGSAMVVCVVAALTARAEPPGEAEESALTAEVELARVLRVALAHNPSLLEARARVASYRERIDVSGQRPDPELKYEQWNVPLSRPYALGEASMLMVGLRQSFPAPGSLPARRLVATNEAEIADSDLRTRELDLAAQVKQAFAEYTRTEAEARIHRDHVDLTNHLIEVARVQYASNRLGQEDVLRTSVEAARLHSDLIAVEQERRSAAALLNVLMGRAPEAPLGKPKAVSTTAALAQVATVKTERPEIVAASGAVARSAAALDATRAEAKWPMFMVGLDYVYDPMLVRSGYTAMVGMTLPWLNGGRKAEVRAAEAELTAQQQALEAVKLTTQYQLADAAARVKAAQQVLSILDESVLPQMKRGFEASRASFASGGGSALGVIDSLRSLLQIQVDRTRAVARLAASIAAFERAAGTTTPTLDPSRT